ncbi:MAG: hypothetical protein ARM1_0431 [Candidatus Micrarchaeota archaeon]|nr:MAG: hypothetical protein ARM1_0431 [Candidatus Micrarchaeota archaeon]
MPIHIAYIAALIFAAVYALFDVFNKREIPSIFAYIIFILSIAIAFLSYYTDASIFIIDLLIVALLIALGYPLSRTALIGDGDIFEIATLSALLPFIKPLDFNLPYWIYGINGVLPFALTIIINSGFFGIILTLIFYLPLAVRRFGFSSLARSIKPDYIDLALLLSYILFLFVATFSGIGIISTVIMSIIFISAIILRKLEVYIEKLFIRHKRVIDIKEGDVLAIDHISKEKMNELDSLKIGRAITSSDVRKLRERLNLQEELPVYVNGVPFSVAILIGLAFGIVYGNIIILIL